MCYTVDDLNGYEDRAGQGRPVAFGQVRQGPGADFAGDQGLGVAADAGQATKILLELRPDLPLMIAVGNKNKIYFAEAERLHTLFLKSRPPAEDAKPESITVWFFPNIQTILQGAELLAQPALKVPEKIANFMTVWLVKNSDAKGWKWRQLKKPYE